MGLHILSVMVVVLGLCMVISVPVGLFNMKIFQAIQGAKCTGMSALKAFTPFVNLTVARKLAYGRSPGFRIALLACGALLLFRLVSLLLVAVIPILIVYSSLTTLLCIALYWSLYILNALDFCRMFNCGLITILCSVVAAPIGYYMLSTQVLGYFKSVEDEVSERFGA